MTGNKRLLIFQPDHLGDIILSEPAVRLLRERLPSWRLIAVVGPWSAEVVNMAWSVDSIVEVNFPGFTRSNASRWPTQPYLYLGKTSERLRSLQADDAIVLRDDAWWAAWLARTAVGRHVVTSDDRQTRLFATRAITSPTAQHRTAVAIDIASGYLREAGLGNVELNQWDMSPHVAADHGQMSEAQPILPEDSTGRPTIVIHPGSGAEVKSWPLHNWHAVIGSLPDARVVLTGSTQENVLCDALAEAFTNTTSLAGATSLQGLATILKRATVVVGTDNGPLHLAGALGVPTVRLFGPSNPNRYGPWPGTPGQTVISAGWCCRRCEDLSPARPAGCGCMLAISPDRVTAAIREVIERAA